jgi:hypothetical protein
MNTTGIPMARSSPVFMLSRSRKALYAMYTREKEIKKEKRAGILLV